MDLIAEKHWHAFYVKVKHEKKVCALLSRLDVEAYLPLISEKRRWSDRVKTLEKPLISGYIFCKIQLSERYEILEIPGVLNILKFAGKWAPIPDNQIETLRIFLESPDSLKQDKAIPVGRRARIVSGPFCGAEGIVRRQGKHARLVLSIESLATAFSVELNSRDLESISDDSK